MKTYQKPALLALSLSANDKLCACVIDIVGDNMDETFRQFIDDLFEDTSKLFLTGEGCETEIDIDGYCKNLPSPEGVVFNS